MDFEFEIFSVEAGWFEAIIRYGEKAAAITNSYYMGNDAPRILLKNIAELYIESFGDCWLCWHDEPGAYILHIKKQNENAIFEIYDSKKPSYKLPSEGISLYSEVTEKYFEAELPFKINLK